MHLHSYRLHNYRRMRDVRIDLASDISIFVGANNSGKTSATQAIQSFLSSDKERFSLYDFSSHAWVEFDDIGDPAEGAEARALPLIALDLWFEVGADDLGLVVPLLPSLTWQGTQVGVRIEFGAADEAKLLQNFRTAREEARNKVAAMAGGGGQYVPWPKTLTDYLQKELTREFELRYFVLDRAQFDSDYKQANGYDPLPLRGELGGNINGGQILKAIVRVDALGAQRHLADPSAGAGTNTARSEDLSKRLSHFYQRNLDQRQDDHSALMALFHSETELNKHLATVFEPTLERLKKLGYPGVKNPRMVIRSALNPASIMKQDARVHYLLGEDDDGASLPDTYNGLGFKNLIYMVVELLDAHARWATDENRPPLHLVFIEEPEAHLHAQLQQVFIRNVLELLKVEEAIFQSQLVVTTHSPHILYERGFKPIRYFRRQVVDGNQSTQVLNLSVFYDSTPQDRDFLQRYLKLTHCDLFFADAAILVEGNVERLLLPSMVELSAPSLRSACLSILEVGGAFAHRFKSLIEFLGLVTLVVTDLDSVQMRELAAAEDDDDIEFEDEATEGEAPKRQLGKACLASAEHAVTSNPTLSKWLPRKQTIADLFNATDEEKTQTGTDGSGIKVRVAYQTPIEVRWNGTTATLSGRTLEEAFGLQNADWCQAAEQQFIGLRLRTAPNSAVELAKALNQRVTSKGFDKTKFALGILTQPPESWLVPKYIEDGLKWLEDQVDLEAAMLAEEPKPDDIIVDEAAVEAAE